jgi:hypothetical protein
MNCVVSLLGYLVRLSCVRCDHDFAVVGRRGSFCSDRNLLSGLNITVAYIFEFRSERLHTRLHCVHAYIASVRPGFVRRTWSPPTVGLDAVF